MLSVRTSALCHCHYVTSLCVRMHNYTSLVPATRGLYVSLLQSPRPLSAMERRRRRIAVTAAERESRLVRDRDRARVRRAAETDEERYERLCRQRERRRERRAAETAEQRQLRLQRDRERRQGQTADDREAIQQRRVGREEKALKQGR